MDTNGIPIIGAPKPKPKKWPVLKHEGLLDFNMELADQQIRAILMRLDKNPQPLSQRERAVIINEIGNICGGLMAYAVVMHDDLKAIEDAAVAVKN